MNMSHCLEPLALLLETELAMFEHALLASVVWTTSSSVKELTRAKRDREG